jgi:DNA replication protein DnaC
MAEIFDVMMMAKELGLTHLGNGEVDLTDERVSNLDYLQNVLQQEMDMRLKARAKKYTKRSRLPDRHYDYNYISSGLQWQLDRIKNFDFKTEHQNILIIGKCCRGKTSLAVDISLEAIQKGAMVVYVTFEELIKCSSKKSHPWRYLVESDLVVIDELFYTTPTEEELLLFYKAIMKLSNERSLILISNRDLPLWNEMKADRHVIETLSARLSHNSQMIYL